MSSISIDNLIGLIIGLIAYIILYIGKGIQKYAIEGLKVDKSIKSSGIWIFGTILTAIYMFIQWAALLFAPINIIAPIEGIGLIVLLIFSYYILKEDISRFELIGVGGVIAGVVLITLFNYNPSEISFTDFNFPLFIIFSISILGVEGVLIIISKLNKYKAAGLIIGTCAGSFMAFQTAAKRVTAIPDPTISIIFTVITLVTAVATLGITQFAFTKADANVVVPCFTSASIILATIVGFFTLNEAINLVQIAGFVLVIIGVILLTGFKETIQEEIEE
ncbi:MAG: hypothetical protein GF329_16300 [Candidatus Lokiarchaeota archaeon]|nr:hypothetical protein [Candidatus Lokiarchaeota archaeon]